MIEPVLLAAGCGVCPSTVQTSLLAEALALQTNHGLISCWAQQLQLGEATAIPMPTPTAATLPASCLHSAKQHAEHAQPECVRQQADAPPTAEENQPAEHAQPECARQQADEPPTS